MEQQEGKTNQSPTPGPWIWTFFCKPNGEPIKTVFDVADTISGSAHYSERTELYGVTLADQDSHADGRATVVCYTGNGPNAHNNARLIAAAPDLLTALQALLAWSTSEYQSNPEIDAQARAAIAKAGA